MKKVISVFTFSLIAIMVSAQVDVTLNPLGALFGNPDVAVEIGASENFGVEVGLGTNLGTTNIFDVEYKRSGISGFLAGKYYFNPDENTEGFNIGAYTRFKNLKREASSEEHKLNTYKRTKLGVGVVIGWKWVTKNNIVMELDLGGGRNFVNKTSFEYPDETGLEESDLPGLKLDLMTRFAIGYRF